MKQTRIVIFAKAPVPGRAKTRLIPALGEDGAARLAHEMLLDTVAEALAANLAMPELCVDPHPLDPHWNGLLPTRDLRVTAQGEGDLGARLARAAKAAISRGDNVLLIGTDCPGLGRDRLREAALALATHDAFIHPVEDGGYALLGLRQFDPSLFADIAWSTPAVAEATIFRIAALGWTLQVGETLRDIDVPADLPWAARGTVAGRHIKSRR